MFAAEFRRPYQYSYSNATKEEAALVELVADLRSILDSNNKLSNEQQGFTSWRKEDKPAISLRRALALVKDAKKDPDVPSCMAATAPPSIDIAQKRLEKVFAPLPKIRK